MFNSNEEVRGFLSIGSTRNHKYIPAGVFDDYSALAVRVSFRVIKNAGDTSSVPLPVGEWVFTLGYFKRGKFTNVHNRFEAIKHATYRPHIVIANDYTDGFRISDVDMTQALADMAVYAQRHIAHGKTSGFARALMRSALLLIENGQLASYTAGLLNVEPVDHTCLRTIILNSK